MRKRHRIVVGEKEGDLFSSIACLPLLRGKEVSSFGLDGDFALHPSVSFLGPDIGLFRGMQYPMLSYGFGLFRDAAPDSCACNVRLRIPRREQEGMSVCFTRG